MVQTKFVKYTQNLESITQILDIAKIHENYFLDIANESKFEPLKIIIGVGSRGASRPQVSSGGASPPQLYPLFT